MSQLELIENDGITNRVLEWFDENEKPDRLGRRSFYLTWDDFRAFLMPGQTRNNDGSVHRAQAYFADPQKWIDKGFLPKSTVK